jgi:nitrogen regulatory protein P-II 1
MGEKRVTAIIRTDVVDEIETRLRRLGVRGITVTRVEGYGESSHLQIDIFTDEDHAQAIVDTILSTARGGAAGDGIVAVSPVDTFHRVREH